MNISKVTVSLGQKINMGNYETRDIHVSMDIEPTQGEDPALLIEGGRKILGKYIGQYYTQIAALRNKESEPSLALAQAEQEVSMDNLPF